MNRPPKKRKDRPPAWITLPLIALAVALVIRFAACEPYRIPSSSMESALRAGDHILISKLSYGPRLPVTLGIPFTSLYVPGLELPYRRVGGFNKVGRGDLLVFNFPADNLRPVDRREPFVKRVTGLPGDSVQIADKIVFVNGAVSDLPAVVSRQLWYIYVTVDAPAQLAEDLSALSDDIRNADDPRVTALRDIPRAYAANLSHAEADSIRLLEGVETIDPLLASKDSFFRSGSGFADSQRWNADQFGPVLVPSKGYRLKLHEESWGIYRHAINDLEGASISQTGIDTFSRNGQPVTEYEFTQDYYFVLGDNRDDSEDSRAWGFVPESHVIGRAAWIYFSRDPESGAVNWSRFGQRLR